MKARMFLFPNYVDVWSALYYSPTLKQFIEENLIEITQEYYDGSARGLPQRSDIPVLVRTSTRMAAGEEMEVATICEERGFICFYDDTLITPGGIRPPSELVAVTQALCMK